MVEANKTDLKKIKKVKEQLEKANANIVGVVLNKIKKGAFRNYYSQYNNYTGKKDSKGDARKSKSVRGEAEG